MADLYLSGGITGVKNYQELFQEAESRLLQAGYEVVINPVKVQPLCAHRHGGLDDKEHGWLCNMRYDLIAMMQYCDAIALMPNWYASRGARVELTLAQGLGFEVGTVEQWIERAK